MTYWFLSPRSSAQDSKHCFGSPDHHQRNGRAHLLHVGLLDLNQHRVFNGQNFDKIHSSNVTVPKLQRKTALSMFIYLSGIIKPNGPWLPKQTTLNYVRVTSGCFLVL